jgi:hypothetical protein
MSPWLLLRSPEAGDQGGTVENGFDANRELLAALFRVAFPEAMPDRAFQILLARLGTNTFQPASLADHAAVRANRAVCGVKSMY